MEDNVFKIALALSRDSEISGYVSRLRDHFRGLPLKIDTFTDARRLLVEVREENHDLVICSNPLAGMEVFDLLTELRRLVAGVQVFLLSENPDSHTQELAAEHVVVPIVNWSQFLTRIQECVPEDLKAKYGLKRGDSVILEKLKIYGAKINEDYQTNALLQSPGEDPYLMIPKSVESNEGDLRSSHFIEEDRKKAQVSTLFVTDPKLIKQSQKFDLVVLLVLIFVSGVFYYYSKDSDSETFFSLRNLSFLIPLVSISFFFLSRIFDKFLLSQKSS